MPTSKQEFIDVFTELRTEFPDAVRSCIFKRPSVGGTYDPRTEETTGGEPAINETLHGIADEFSLGQYDGMKIQVGDGVIMALDNEFEQLTPRTDNVTVDIDGVEHQIVASNTDPMRVVWTVQVRRL